MTVRVFTAAGLTLAISAGCGLHALDPARRPENIASVLARSTDWKSRAAAAATSAEAVRADSANPYRWAGYGEALVAVNRVQDARPVFQRALELAPDLPQIWFHDASFHFQLNETALALRSVGRILEEVSDYDTVFFSYFDQRHLSATEVLPSIEQDERASRAYAEHLIAVGNVDGAQEAWHTLLAHHFLDNRLTALYISALLQNHRYDVARQDWAASQGPSDYPQRNLIFNGDFERDPTACPLDWVIQPSEHFDTLRDDSVAHHGRWSLKVRFHGDGNVSYENIAQMVPVHAGKYHFQAWIRTYGITTDEGIGVQIGDVENPARLRVRTRSMTGSHDWTPIDAAFTVPEASRLISIRLVRSPSLKFDNAIAGMAWLDSVSLQQDPG